MVPADINPLARFHGRLVGESLIFRTGRLLEGHRTYPTLLSGKWAFQNGDAGVSNEELMHKRKVSIRHT